jgi:transcriptional regulator with XRE-family HTH domain
VPRPPRQPPPPRPVAGARLRALREAAGLTQAELAHRVGEKQTTLSLWERSGRPPRSDALPKLAKALGASIGALLGEAVGDAPLAPIDENPGHVGELERAFDEVRKLPRRQQRRVLEFVVTFVNEYKRKAC